MGALLAAALSSPLATTPAAAAGEASLTIQPAVMKVVAGADFAMTVFQDAPIAVSGAQASILFDPKILQIESVTPGPGYAQAPFLLPKDQAANIRSANQSGRLAQVAAVFVPPAAIAAGPAAFLVIRFRAIGCGQTPIGLPFGGPFDAQMIDGRPDTYGNAVSVVTTGGQVTTCVNPSEATRVQDDPALAAATLSSTPSAAVPVAAAVLLILTLSGGLALLSRRRRRAE